MGREALAAGTDLDAPCYEGRVFPRHVRDGQVGHADPDPYGPCVHGIVPLVLAVLEMQADTLEVLLEHGAARTSTSSAPRVASMILPPA